jgi:hypothetical protein
LWFDSPKGADRERAKDRSRQAEAKRFRPGLHRFASSFVVNVTNVCMCDNYITEISGLQAEI